MGIFKNRINLIILGLLAVVGLVFINVYPEYLWFESFGYDAVWIFRWKSELYVWFITFLIAFFWLSTNAGLANKYSQRLSESTDYEFNTPFVFLNKFFDQLKSTWASSGQQPSIPEKLYGWVLRGVVFGLSVLFGLGAKAWWEEFYIFRNQVQYGMADPVFGHDISFYLFSLPFFNHIQNWLLSLLIVTLFLVGWIYFSRNILLVIFSKNTEFKNIKRHIIVLLSIFLLLLAAGAWIGLYDLLFSSTGVVYGAGYTDVNILLPVKKILIGLFCALSLSILALIKKPSVKLPYLMFGLLILLYFVGLRLVPNIVQNYIVSPNELVKEVPFIEDNIKFTREAYGLNKISDTQFPASHDLTIEDITQNDTIINNIRLWNQEPLKQTFSQLQEIRLYYEFDQVDVDRYVIDGKPQQVMLSARELDSQQLTAQAQTWTNRHLIYTHGYGLCMTPVNQITEDGLPEFFIKDLPPKSVKGVSVKQPAIYFGEKTHDYVIVNTKEEEFDYPKGDLNVYTNYSGKGGISMGSILNRALYAFKFSDMKLFMTTLITGESKLLYDRSIQIIPKKIAPFLVFDQDPYLVVTDEGRMVWIYDAYTVSNKFPYSDPFKGRINYIRNSVKITIDAYDGETHFYVSDKTDPIIQTYDSFYPELFKSMNDMPETILNHIRYPKDMFLVQSMMLSTYHMTNPKVFYNREDLWEFPQETYGESEKTMMPYYLVTRLPGDEKESFVLMLPFTPTNKNNMIAWLAAKCDPDSYGEFTVLKLPKEKTVYGPIQIESRIDQNTEISKDLTLWSQAGSTVIRGNLMIIPIKNSLLYVEPIYLQATQSKLPELKRVVVSYEDKVVMGQNLTESIQMIFGSEVLFNQDIEAILSEEGNEDLKSQIIDTFDKVKMFLQNAEWASFGDQMVELELYINKLRNSEN